MNEIEYHLVYYLFILFLYVSFRFFRIFEYTSTHLHRSHLIAFLVITILSIFIGNRSLDVGTDTTNYFYRYTDPLGGNNLSLLGLFTGQEPIYLLIIIVSSIFGGFNLFLGIMNFCMNGCYYIACYLLTKRSNISPLWPFILILTSFTCWNQQINIIRSGLALSICLIFLYYFFNRKYRTAILFAVLSIGIHISTLIIIGSIIIVHCLYNVKNKYFYFLYVIGIILSFLGYSVLTILTQYVPELSIVERHAINIDNIDYRIGFRLDFVFYNSIFLLYFIVYKSYQSKIGRFFLFLYIILSCIFFLWFALPYSDRMGAYSWMLIPFLISYSQNVRILKSRYSSFLYLPFYLINYII